MAPHFPPSWMDELRSRSDLVQIVSGYVSLKKSGRKYWGLCPFHGEKTASFSVDSDRQLYYCFGCKAGGNVVNFIMDIERCTFPEAVAFLADRAHMTLPETEKDEDYERRRSQRERLLAANLEAAKFYHHMLSQPAGAAALDYLRRRGVSDGMITRFGLGAAPEEWDALTRHMQKLGYTLSELSLAGLSVVKGGAEQEKKGSGTRAFDMFRNRAIFPIIDMYGNVLAFGGRSLGNQQPKYLNTADTPVFNKRRGVYAANLLRKQRNLSRIVLVEGYMDVVSLTQFGVEGVCATLGTSLTAEQTRLLRRFAPQVYLAYDGDSAGQHAILRGLDIFAEEGFPARVLDFPDGLDPDEFIRRDGPEGFRKLPAIAPTAYRLRLLREKLDLTTQDGKVAYGREGAALVSALDPVERETYIQDLELYTGFPRETILEQIRLSRKESAESPASSPRRPGQLRLREDAVHTSDTLAAQEMLISLLASGQIPKDIVDEKDFEDDELKSLYRRLLAGASAASLLDDAPDEISRSRFARILLAPSTGSTDDMIAMARDCVSRLRTAVQRRRYSELQEQLSAAPPEQIPSLLTEAQKVRAELNEISRRTSANTG